jgi:hypothetical protein
MHTWIAPIGLANFVKYDNASRTTRDTRGRRVWWKRSMGWVFRARVLIARGCAVGITLAYPTYGSVEPVAC